MRRGMAHPPPGPYAPTGTPPGPYDPPGPARPPRGTRRRSRPTESLPGTETQECMRLAESEIFPGLLAWYPAETVSRTFRARQH